MRLSRSPSHFKASKKECFCTPSVYATSLTSYLSILPLHNLFPIPTNLVFIRFFPIQSPVVPPYPVLSIILSTYIFHHFASWFFVVLSCSYSNTDTTVVNRKTDIFQKKSGSHIDSRFSPTSHL